jgi:hypothetical protein
MPDNILARREFLSGASKGAALMTAASYSRVLGANDKIGLGLIGAGERGRHDMTQFQQAGGVEVRAICDAYAAMIDLGQKKAPGAKGFADYRKVLEMKEVDVCLIATPDH